MSFSEELGERKNIISRRASGVSTSECNRSFQCRVSHSVHFDSQNSGVGKSSIAHRFVSETFDDNITNTIAAAYFDKKLCVNGDAVKVCIWDTAGGEKFRALAPLYYRGASGIVLVYDITKVQSFQSLTEVWVPALRANTDSDVSLVVVGNKLDLDETRVVPAEVGRNYAEFLNATFIETSAKTGQNVESVLVQLAMKILEKKQPSTANARQRNLIRLSTTSTDEANSSQKTRRRKCRCTLS
ncbi:ras-related protein Rab-22A-like isoform X2 [Acanthaster planci]|uniref:Ras-related protein Rab-22A-like isoform X2 n=1 Tax=Acanthaster planci TaxID=133434 RepID=A0A8B7YKE9_ACAPL|nr:ras-related protein Rab-22A-like isoform X2 [Acanthaster planci]